LPEWKKWNEISLESVNSILRVIDEIMNNNVREMDRDWIIMVAKLFEVMKLTQ